MLPLPPDLPALTFQQQACLEMLQKTATALWPLVLVVVSIVLAFLIPFWPRRNVVDLVLIKNAEGQLEEVHYMRHGWRQVKAAREAREAQQREKCANGE